MQPQTYRSMKANRMAEWLSSLDLICLFIKPQEIWANKLQCLSERRCGDNQWSDKANFRLIRGNFFNEKSWVVEHNHETRDVCVILLHLTFWCHLLLSSLWFFVLIFSLRSSDNNVIIWLQIYKLYIEIAFDTKIIAWKNKPWKLWDSEF